MKLCRLQHILKWSEVAYLPLNSSAPFGQCHLSSTFRDYLQHHRRFLFLMICQSKKLNQYFYVAKQAHRDSTTTLYTGSYMVGCLPLNHCTPPILIAIFINLNCSWDFCRGTVSWYYNVRNDRAQELYENIFISANKMPK